MLPIRQLLPDLLANVGDRLRHLAWISIVAAVPSTKQAQRLVASLLAATLLWWGLPTANALARTATAAPTSSIQPYIDGVVERITDFTLDNGVKFIVLERHQSPVISFMTYVNVGAAYEADGKTGAAHYLEHLAFKGTPRIGTSDYEAEKPLLERMDRLFDQINAAKAAGQDDQVAQLQADFDAVSAEAAAYVKQNELGQIVDRSGGVGLNATTSADATRYFYSFPSNKLELWMSLESERFLEPVFREFYEEKEVILEERRMRVDNSPIGQMVEVFLETAFQEHPYRRPVIGYADDLANMTRADVQEFFETYYTPEHMIIAVVGDVDPDEVQQLAETYFGRYPARPSTPAVTILEPEQTEPQEVVLELPSQPWYLEGYHRPAKSHPDDAVYEIITSILSNGRTSRFYKSLIEGQQLALNAQGSNGFPGDQYANLVLMYGLTAPGHTLDELATAMHAEIERLKTEPVSTEELEQAQTQARAALLRTLSSNQGMASLLPEYEAKTGSWRNLFEELKAFEAVTPEDVQRVAAATFRPENLTVGKILPLANGSAPAGG